MRRPLGVLFDFGDTVLHLDSLDTLAGNRRLLEFAEVNPGISAEDVQSVVDEFRWIYTARDESMIEHGCQSFQRLLYDTLGVSFRIGYTELEREFWNASVKYSPVTGIYELLDMLEARGIITGIISNTIFCSSVLKEELAKHNLENRFSFLITSADYGVRKPHPHIFRIAVKKMNLETADIWFIGDKPDFDIKGAIDYGLYPVWYNWRNEKILPEGDYLEVKTLQELLEKIELL
ncbi:MAG: HAD family hydrolase [Dehalococcoidales bacterium]|nr:HAD family hydrolase [Dehalococcoidales bacterium]